MKTTYTVYPAPSGKPTTGEVDWPAEPSYRQIWALVRPLIGQEPMERVRILHPAGYTDMFVSEIGHQRLTTRDPLPINAKATELYRANALKNDPRAAADPDALPTIAGGAVVFDRPVWF